MRSHPDSRQTLTGRQRAFVLEYLVDFNGTQAAIRAGYSKRGARVQATRLLTNAAIRAEIERGQERLANKLEITAEQVLKELALVAFANMADYIRPGKDGSMVFDIEALDRDRAVALSQLEVNNIGERTVRARIKLHDKLSALDKLGKHLGLFADKTIITGSTGGPIKIEQDDILDSARRIAFLLSKAGVEADTTKP